MNKRHKPGSNLKLTCACCAVNMTMQTLHLGTNIKMTDWAPQNDVLGHPAVKAFVTHAGINSLYEAAYHAKPILSIPLISDQPANAAKVMLAPLNQLAVAVSGSLHAIHA